MSELKEVGGENGLVKNIREVTQQTVAESQLPTIKGLGFESTVGIYGYPLIWDEEGKLIYVNQGLISKVDRIGDPILRTFDEHIVKRPWDILKRHPRKFAQLLFNGPMRRRGTPEEIAQNAERLGLSDVYVRHPRGIEVAKPEIYTQGRVLQDIYRADLINSSQLDSIDRFQALAAAAQYVRWVHDQYGAIGELLSNDIIFQGFEDGKVVKPILNLPDEIYNPQKHFPENAKKATDILDFLVHIGFEEVRRSDNNWQEIKKALDTIVKAYGNHEVLKVVLSFAQRGRLTLTGDEDFLNLPATIASNRRFRDIFSSHNKARLSYKTEQMGQMRQLIIQSCNNFLDSEKNTN